MKSVVAVIAGACYSLAYVAPEPMCYIGLMVSTALVILLRWLP